MSWCAQSHLCCAVYTRQDFVWDMTPVSPPQKRRYREHGTRELRLTKRSEDDDVDCIALGCLIFRKVGFQHTRGEISCSMMKEVSVGVVQYTMH